MDLFESSRLNETGALPLDLRMVVIPASGQEKVPFLLHSGIVGHPFDL